MRVISVTPAGRLPYLEILVPYLLANREYIDEHHFWVNTSIRSDVLYLEKVARMYPTFFKLKRRPLYHTNIPKHRHRSIWQYHVDYQNSDELYIRFDDDICFMAPDAVPALIKYRLEHPEPFLVFGNIVNNPLCSYLHQQRGLLPKECRAAGYLALDKVGMYDTDFVDHLHRKFLEDASHDAWQQWKMPDHTLGEYERFGINVMSWFGKDFQKIPELTNPKAVEMYLPLHGEMKRVNDEERMFTVFLTQRFGRPNVICGDAVFSHFAYVPQREYLESTPLLAAYRQLAINQTGMVFATEKNSTPFLEKGVQGRVLGFMALLLKKVFPSVYWHLKRRWK